MALQGHRDLRFTDAARLCLAQQRKFDALGTVMLGIYYIGGLYKFLIVTIVKLDKNINNFILL